jgi:hypothetical protein
MICITKDTNWGGSLCEKAQMTGSTVKLEALRLGELQKLANRP